MHTENKSTVYNMQQDAFDSQRVCIAAFAVYTIRPLLSMQYFPRLQRLCEESFG